MYAILATLTVYRTDKDGTISYFVQQIPTFYLNECVQGIVSESHAEKIARDIILPIKIGNVELSVTATKL